MRSDGSKKHKKELFSDMFAPSNDTWNMILQQNRFNLSKDVHLTSNEDNVNQFLNANFVISVDNRLKHR